jgi:hypothetical protein
MTSTPAATSSSRDWRNTYENSIKHESNPAKVWCPFPVRPEINDTIPKKYTVNMEHILMETGHVPWSGYYTNYKHTRIALSNAWGIWFELKRRGNEVIAIRVARNSLKLLHLPVEGLDMRELIQLGEPIDATAPPSCAQTPFQTPYNPPNVLRDEPEERPERDDDMCANVGQSTDTVCKPPRRPTGRPRGNGNDPYGLDNLLDKPIGKNNVRLEGIPPEKFTGERGQTIPFLTKFK